MAMNRLGLGLGLQRGAGASAPPVIAPENTVLPAISGNAHVGSTLTASTGTWLNGVDTFAYQWKADGTNVGSNQNTYVPVSGDVGKVITVVVTATNAGGSTPASSGATSAVIAVPVNTVAPAITGSALVGLTLTCSTGTWSGGGSQTYAYRWKSAGSNVGSNQNTYVPVTGDAGNTITCTVTATNAAGSGTPTESAATAAVDVAVGVSGTDTGSIVNNAAPTFTGKSFGAARADRCIRAWVTYQDGAANSAFTGCTIGGVVATKVAEAAASGSVNAALYTAAVPTGTTGDIVPSISNAGATLDCQVSVVRTVGLANAATDTAGGLTGGSSFTRNNDCPAGGAQIFGCYRDGASGTGNSIDWTNVDELPPEIHFDSNQRSQVTAARINASAQTNQAITATNPGGGVVSFYMAGGSFAPL
ncbi:MAG: hypothetical protein EOQ42_12185 [Mesorhizobium sp.]|uniref:hypothetical protein n=1 Tax=Mesorhizobium sp. TaxID=1871066 RepID=UPI000FE73630|nr:hypothetical protein [Mesorhizobium sp.]RWB27548.1 MAG: hypothetical protein EOQ43_27025 [Mesorhizobium sp.]RWB70036.1 MAG: hypothetical protein EOQ42_12185 [Mesorhizobium sp.]